MVRTKADSSSVRGKYPLIVAYILFCQIMIVREHKITYCGLIGYNTVVSIQETAQCRRNFHGPDLNMK
jgi:hypothetical protein